MGSRRWVQLFPKYSCKNWYKNWHRHFYKTYDRQIWPCKDWYENLYRHFYKTYDHQTWEAGTSTGVDSNETNQAVLVTSLRQNRVANLKHYISTVRVPIATKLGRMITYLDGFLPEKSHNPLIMWSCNITWQTKIIIFLLPQFLWPPNLGGNLNGLLPIKLHGSLTLRSCKIT